MTILEKFEEWHYTNFKDAPFTKINCVTSYNHSTLFCPAGMQRFTELYKHPERATIKTTTTCQACLRLNDIDFLGDGSHLAYFNMLGLFSFGELTVKGAIEFWVNFLYSIDPNKKFDRITIHPEKLIEWTEYYPEHLRHLIVGDSECVWSDGNEASGFCTEIYIDGIEVGNMVNTNGTMIDCGFGLERLEYVYEGKDLGDEVTALKRACTAMIDSFVEPSNKKQGYVLRKLLRKLYAKGGKLEHPFFDLEVARQQTMQATYNKVKDKYRNKPAEWWFDTFGVDLSIL